MTSPLRPLSAPFVVAAPAGARTRTRLHPTAAEEAVLRQVGDHLGRAYRTALADRVRAGRLTAQGRARWRAEQKRAVTVVSSSRWAGAVTRAVEDQYQLGMRALAADITSLTAATTTLAARAAAPVAGADGRVKGYPTAGERFQKTRRLAHLATRLATAKADLAAGRPRIVVGGKRLWRNRNHLNQTGMTLPEWGARWEAARAAPSGQTEAGRSTQ